MWLSGQKYVSFSCSFPGDFSQELGELLPFVEPLSFLMLCTVSPGKTSAWPEKQCCISDAVKRMLSLLVFKGNASQAPLPCLEAVPAKNSDLSLHCSQIIRSFVSCKCDKATGPQPPMWTLHWRKRQSLGLFFLWIRFLLLLTLAPFSPRAPKLNYHYS